MVAALVAGCGTEPTIDPDQDQGDYPYDQIPEEDQRVGDPVKGREYLLNGGYITCGLPKSITPSGNLNDRLAGRTGDNATLPYYWSAATSQEGVRVVSANCLFCHASKLDDEIVIGLGAHDRDFTGDQAGLVDLAGSLISDPTEKQAWMRFRDRTAAIAPFSRTATVGVNPADSFTAALMAHREPTTMAWSNEPMLPLPPAVVVPVDVPPFWRMSKKHAMFYSSSGRGDHARIMMAATMLCSENVEEIREIDRRFVDVRAYITSIEAPKWPYAIDMNLAGTGEYVFQEHCAKCHGSYQAEGGHYPNQLVPIGDVETDPLLVQGETQFAGRFVDWFAQSFWGETSRLEPQPGYIAPPLDGIWATAPFLHNGSVPTIAALLDSSKRPMYWTRTFASTDYDEATVGWKFTALDHGQAGEPNATARSKIYDTTLPGYGNGGHTFGDVLSEDDRRAVIEYLKTL